MKHLFRRGALALGLLLTTGIGVAALSTAALAHPGHGAATQNPALLSSLVTLGGGAVAFSAKTLRQRMGGPAEETKLATALGAASVTRFDDVFTFVVRDALASMKQNGTTLPAPFSVDPKTVATALYNAGTQDGKFDVEHLFDTLFSSDVHMHAMMAVAKSYGAAGEAAYHQVFGQLVADAAGNGAAVSAPADPMHNMNGMDMKGMNMGGMPMPFPAATSSAQH